MKHTPTPWPIRIHDQHENGVSWRYVDFAGGPKLLNDPLRGWREGDPDREQALADAAFIVCACNLFDELVEVATEFLAVCHVTGRTSDAKRVHALIAKAEASHATI